METKQYKMDKIYELVDNIPNENWTVGGNHIGHSFKTTVNDMEVLLYCWEQNFPTIYVDNVYIDSTNKEQVGLSLKKRLISFFEIKKEQEANDVIDNIYNILMCK